MAEAASTKHTTIFHLSDKRFLGRTPDGQQLLIDGESYAKTGMNPMEVLLNALGACAAFDVVEMIRKRRLDLVSYRVELEGDRFDGTPSYYTDVRATHFINAPGLKKDMAERFVDLAMNKYCSVAASLNADLSFTVVIEHDAEDGDS